MSTQQISPNKTILLVTFSLVTLSNLVSRSVMEKVGDNDGEDCPKVSGPAIACACYLITTIYLSFMIFIKRHSLNTLQKVMLGLMAVLCFIIFICFITFMNYLKKSNDSNDSKCLTATNKKAIEYSELILSGTLVLFAIISTFYN